ncbi:MAG: hypothetical protein HUJ68_10315, partial [Clostridia bacterium]|nr:hypothetical protein [Clostridia bacterium]
MEYCHECWNTKGELYFRLDEIDLKKINLFRCCYLEPYKSIDVSDINNIDIKELFNESLSLSPILQEPIKDRCFSCNNLSQKLEKISISLSRACNLNCYHCFFNEHKDTPEMKNAYFSLLEKTKGLSLEELKLTDIGEPFFYFIDTFNFLKKLSFKKDTKKIIFITNLTLLNINRIKLLKKISDITHIQYEFNVSIDGITKETYENTRIGGNF